MLVDNIEHQGRAAPTFGISQGCIAYDDIVFGSGGGRTYVIKIYDTATQAIIRTLTPDGPDSDYYAPSISNNKVVFVRASEPTPTGFGKSQIMLYGIRDDSLSTLDVGTDCIEPAIYDNEIVYNEVVPLRINFGTLFVYGLVSHKKEKIWPDLHFLPPNAKVDLYGGITPSINERYVMWDTHFSLVICYDLERRNLVRFPTPASDKVILRQTAFPGNVVWFGAA